MEQSTKEIAEDETAASAEFTRNDRSKLVGSEVLSASTSSDWPGSSTLTNLKDFDLNKDEMSLSLADPTTNSTGPYPVNDAGITFEEATVRKYGYPSACVGRHPYQLASEGLENRTGSKDRSRDRDLMYEGQDSYTLELSSREDLRRKPSIFEDAKHFKSNQNNVNSDRLGGSSSKILVSSSFSKSFSGQNPKSMAKGVQYKNPLTSAELRTTQGYSTEETSDALMNRSFLSSQPRLDDIVREEPDLSHCGINLREWLESKASEVSKNVRLQLFSQIVHIVDAAHCQGVALMELWPSSFILLETGDVRYIGSLVETELLSVNYEDNTKKRGPDKEISALETFSVKMQKKSQDKLARHELRFVSRFVNDKISNQFNPGIIDMKNSNHSNQKAQNFSVYEGTSDGNAQLEKKWYAFQEGFKVRDLLPYNNYCLGILLFEFLFQFKSIEALSAAMMDLHHLILPPCFLSENPKEAGFCFWLLHPDPSSRPTTREILQSELIRGYQSRSLSNDEATQTDMVANAESDLLLHFLVSLKQHMQDKVSTVLASMELLDADIKVVERRHASRRTSNTRDGDYDSRHDPDLKDHRSIESISRTNVLRDKLVGNINQLENAYFSMRSHGQLIETPDMDRSDKDVLSKRDRWSWVEIQHNLSTMEEKSIDRVGTFFDGICQFARYDKFEVCGTLRNRDILNSNNVICSLSFDREEDYIAAAGVSKKIKIFELGSLLDDYVDVQYPVLEISNKSKFSCICWNKYIKNYLASTDYDGLVQMWDASTGQRFVKYDEHQKRAWSGDFSQVDPTKFASGSDDCSTRIWSINEKNSVATIWNPANICCVQFSAYSSHLLAFGSADYRIYCYDLRHMKIPWCMLAGHRNAVSYVRFLDAETLVSASTDNTLKLWDLKKTSLEGLSPNACSLTFGGHTNQKNFVGLAVLDGYIACGSETNEVYAYYRSLPMPITSHKFGLIDPISGNEISDGNEQFVSSVCWRRKSRMLVAANSSGSMNVLRMV